MRRNDILLHDKQNIYHNAESEILQLPKSLIFAILFKHTLPVFNQRIFISQVSVLQMELAYSQYFLTDIFTIFNHRMWLIK